MAKSSHVLCFISSKGGSGKTVTSASLGTFLAQLGFKVLLIDTDAATNGMTLLFLEQLLRGTTIGRSERGVGLFEVYDSHSVPTIVPLTDSLSFLPAAFHIKDTDQTNPKQVGSTLKAVIDNSEHFDVVLLDAQAGADEFARIATAMSDIHIIVSEYDPISAQGIDRLKLIFSKELSLSSTYTLFNKILPEYAEALGEGMAVARWLPPIPWDVEVVKAFTRRDLAINMNAPNPYTLAIAQVSLGCLADLTGNAIESWQGQALERTTDPIERRLRTLETARDHILHKNSKAKFVGKFVESSLLIIGAMLGLSITLFEKVFANYIDRYHDLSSQPILVLLILIVAGLGTTFLTTWRSLRQRPSIKEAELIESEIVQLKASLDAAHAALRPGEIGVWQTLRRSNRLGERSNAS